MDGSQGGGSGQSSYRFVADAPDDLGNLPPLPVDLDIGPDGLQWPEEQQGHHESGQSSDFATWAQEAGAVPVTNTAADYDYSGRRPIYQLDVKSCLQTTDFANLHNVNYPRALSSVLSSSRVPNNREPDQPEPSGQTAATSMPTSVWYEAPYQPDSLHAQQMALSSQAPMQSLYQAVTAQSSQSGQLVYAGMEPAYQMTVQEYGMSQPDQSSGAMVHVPQQPFYQPAVPAYSIAESLTPPQQMPSYPIRTNLHNYSLGLSRSQDFLRDSMSTAAWDLHQILNRILGRGPQSSHASSPSSHSSVTALLSAGHCAGVTGVGGSMVPGEESRHKAPGSYHPFKPNPESEEEEEQSPEPEFRLDRYETNFQFVLNEPTPAVRSAIKAHVMKEMRRKRRWEKNCIRVSEQAQDAKRKRSSQEEDGASGSHDSSPTDLSSPQNQKKKATAPIVFNKRQAALFDQKVPEFSKVLEHLEKAGAMPYVADPYAAPAPSDMDPFSTTNMNLGPATGALLHHFAWVMPSLMDEIVSGTVFNRIGWLFSAVAVHDPTPAHVIIGYAMIHIANLRGVREPREAIEHKQKGENLIRMRAADPKQRYSDDLIGSMLNVAGWELIMCDAETHAIHIGGAREIVKVRGGIGAMASNRELQNVLFRMDIIRAYIAMSEPRYPTYTKFREMAPLAVNTPPPRGERADNTREGDFCTEALRVIHQLEDVLLLIHTTADSVKKFVVDSQNEAFSASFRESRLRDAMKRATESKETLEQHVRACLSPELSTPRAGLEYTRRLRLAALVFIDAAIEHFFDPEGPGSGRHGLEDTFVGSRHDKITMATWGRSLQMVFHVLLKADRFMLEKPWRAFYFADALVLTMRLPKTSWSAIGEKLAEHLKNRTAPGALVKRESRLSHAVWDLKRNLDWVNGAWDEWETGKKEGARERRATENWYRAEERSRIRAEREAARAEGRRRARPKAAGGEAS